MGSSMYSNEDRSVRASSSGYFTKSANEIFKQNVERRAHDEMNPKGVTIREARDSDNHPNSVPVIINLDFTGSMGKIPHFLIKDGLPKIVSGVIQAGIPDPQILFVGIGDHECDRYPLQVGQFESGDAELDMWLERSYIEGGGGGNGGESYSLAHYFAARHTATDHWDKRGKKGILITIGDEPNLRTYPASAMKEIMGSGDIATFSDAEILEEVKKKWEVFHIMPGMDTRGGHDYWKELLGQNTIWVNNSEEVATAIKDIVINVVKSQGATTTTAKESTSIAEPTVEVKTEKPTEEFL